MNANERREAVKPRPGKGVGRRLIHAVQAGEERRSNARLLAYARNERCRDGALRQGRRPDWVCCISSRSLNGAQPTPHQVLRLFGWDRGYWRYRQGPAAMQALPEVDRVVPRVQSRSVPPRDVSFARSTACTTCTTQGE